MARNLNPIILSCVYRFLSQKATTMTMAFTARIRLFSVFISPRYCMGILNLTLIHHLWGLCGKFMVEIELRLTIIVLLLYIGFDIITFILTLGENWKDKLTFLPRMTPKDGRNLFVERFASWSGSFLDDFLHN